MHRFALPLLLGLSAIGAPAFAGGSAQQNSVNNQNNSGMVNQSPIGGVNHNTQINNNSISEYSFGPGINCPTPGLAFSSSYAGGSGGFDGYSASVSYVMPLGGSIGRACKELAVEIARQRQLDTQVTMIHQCAGFAAQGIQIDVASFPEFSVCSAVQVNGNSAVN
ncbi:hypothetical protein SynSYN20_01587 [Synechococcus sp. SYN20]|uniref:hypothetical protein n=1 Tax=Synechococcus sp. SYN20 TaxID=1050714 RepID=UPI001648ABD2|nr:hypothetical protein [Synechococcus sp. SYN20]QNJ25914.1 hypothetical protein SynSYN20_01587 [Synechococcus sp. SYN20]